MGHRVSSQVYFEIEHISEWKTFEISSAMVSQTKIQRYKPVAVFLICCVLNSDLLSRNHEICEEYAYSFSQGNKKRTNEGMRSQQMWSSTKDCLKGNVRCERCKPRQNEDRINFQCILWDTGLRVVKQLILKANQQLWWRIIAINVQECIPFSRKHYI